VSCDFKGLLGCGGRQPAAAASAVGCVEGGEAWFALWAVAARLASGWQGKSPQPGSFLFFSRGCTCAVIECACARISESSASWPPPVPPKSDRIAPGAATPSILIQNSGKLFSGPTYFYGLQEVLDLELDRQLKNKGKRSNV